MLGLKSALVSATRSREVDDLAALDHVDRRAVAVLEDVGAGVREQRGGGRLVVVARLPAHLDGRVLVRGGILLHRLLGARLAVLVVPLVERAAGATGGARATRRRGLATGVAAARRERRRHGSGATEREQGPAADGRPDNVLRHGISLSLRHRPLRSVAAATRPPSRTYPLEFDGMPPAPSRSGGGVPCRPGPPARPGRVCTRWGQDPAACTRRAGNSGGSVASDGLTPAGRPRPTCSRTTRAA